MKRGMGVWEGCEKYAKKKTGLSRMRGRLLARMEALLEARRTSTLGAGKMGRGGDCFAKGGVWEMRVTPSRAERKTSASVEERVARIASTDGWSWGRRVRQGSSG